MAIIEVEHVTKEYRLGAMQSLKTIASRMIGRNPPDSNNFKALDDISFNIEKGEVVGIIGHNGAGKSTLLKLLSRITTPTSGRITVGGKIAPLIEVGAGLVGEMTGRENIYLNASILGMSRRSIESRIEEVIEFGELAKFIDTPIKRYSSGMQVRLGFAIATSVPAEILIVDEVLAVGDLNFQKKCYSRIEKIIKEYGSTVLVVSHNMRQVEKLCTRALLLENGKLAMDDLPPMTCNKYFEQSVGVLKDDLFKLSDHNKTQTEVSVLDISMHLNKFEKAVTSFETHDSITIKVKIVMHEILDDLDVGFGVTTSDLINVCLFRNPCPLSLSAGVNTLECIVPNFCLVPGSYFLRIGIRASDSRLIWYGENIHPFKIIPRLDFPMSRLGGQALVEIDSKWITNGQIIGEMNH